MSWSDERVDTLKKLWADGLSASQIACRMGGVTRNAVISKVHRLGLSGRATTSRLKSRRPPRPRAQPAPKPPKARQRGGPPIESVATYVPPAEELVIPLAERKSLGQLTGQDCRWPIGDPQQPDFHFCGKKKIPGLPYCEVHAARAFATPDATRRALERAAAQVLETV